MTAAYIATSEQQRLASLHATIKRILEISGAPGMSIAVVHHGQTIHTAHYGYRDAEKRIPPDSDTRYSMNSMTKAVVAEAAGMLDEEGVIDMHEPVKKTLPNFYSQSKEVEEQASLIDLLSHRSGITNFDTIWLGSYNSLLVGRDQVLPIFSTLKPKLPFRTSFLYNNWGYEVTREVMEKKTGKPLGDILGERIFQPLGMTRTSTSWECTDDNVMKSYGVLHDLSPVDCGRPQIGQGTVMEAAGGTKTTLNDLIRLYKAFMKACIDQFEHGRDSTLGSIFKNCRTLISNHARLPGLSFREQGYATGWVRTQFPGQLGRLSFNSPVGPSPVVGKDSPSRLGLSHNGFMPGSTTCVHLLLETETAIIVLQNSYGANDSADIIGQLLIEHLFDVKAKNDYVSLAEIYTRNSLNIPNSLRLKLDAARIPGTKSRELSNYVGRYFNEIKNYYIEVFLEGESLKFSLQGSVLDTYELRHYHYDAFEWLLTWDQMAARGRVVQLYGTQFYVLFFGADKDDKICCIEWAWDPNRSDDREIFTKA
ncbi:hypothetical protein B7463_g5473, partial [Scytalidium lignicola]